MKSRDTLYRMRFTRQLGKYQVMLDYIPGKWFSTGTDNQIAAIHWADAKVEADLRGKGYNRQDLTLATFAKGFFSESDPYGIRKRDIKHGNHYEESYYKAKQRWLNLYIIPRFGKQTMNSLTAVAIEDWFLDLKSVTKGVDLSDDTKNKVLTAFRDVLKEAIRQGYIHTNAADEVEMINEKNQHRVPFSPEEMALLFPEDDEKLLKVWGSVMWAAYFLIFRDTGFRPCEIHGLSESQYFPELHGLFSRKSVNLKREIRERIKTTGKGKDYKIGILTSQTERFLKRRIAECRANGEEYLFLINGKFVNTSTTNKHFVLAAKRVLELKGRTQYCMRHSLETDLAGKVENKVVAELMAHTKFNPTYDHRTPEMLLKELQPVRDLLEKR